MCISYNAEANELNLEMLRLSDYYGSAVQMCIYRAAGRPDD